MSTTDFLFAMPSFLSGLARTLDLGGTLSRHSYNISRTPQDADELAIASDWQVVGRDLLDAMNQHALTFEHDGQEASSHSG